MMTLIQILFVICLGGVNLKAQTPPPAPIPEQSMYFYSHGSLRNAVFLPQEGTGFIKIFRLIPRQYGSSDLIQMIQQLGLEISEKFPGRDRLEVGDIAAKNGGYAAYHASHQNGLDADIAYMRVNNLEQNPNTGNAFAEKFVLKGKLSANFDLERNWYAVERLASYATINRIFVDPAVKRAFCEKYYDAKDELAIKALSLMQPLVAHDDHMHVRMNCPLTSKHCTGMPGMSLKTGCAAGEIEMDLEMNNQVEAGC